MSVDPWTGARVAPRSGGDAGRRRLGTAALLVGLDADIGRPGDVIIAVGDRRIASIADRVAAVGGPDAGDVVTLDIARHGRIRRVEATTGEIG